jgi:hypothetical protein
MYEYANKGLRMFFFSEIGKCICLVLIMFRPFTILAALVSIVLEIIQLVGLYIAGSDIDDYKLSFFLIFAYLGIMWAATASSSVPLLTLFFSTLGYIVSFYAYYNICVATKQARIYLGGDKEELNNQTSLLIKLQIADKFGAILLAILSEIGFYSLTVSLIFIVIGFIAAILFLRFIYQSFQTFGKHYISADEEN